jgi:hypothetical protein
VARQRGQLIGDSSSKLKKPFLSEYLVTMVLSAEGELKYV